MKPNYIRQMAVSALFLAYTSMTVFGQTPAPTPVRTPTPTPVPTPFVAPPMPQILYSEKPNFFSYDPAKLAAPFHTESAAEFAGDPAACRRETDRAKGI